MFKKSLLAVSSVMVLAACSSVPQDKLYQGEYVTGETMIQSPDALTSDPLVTGDLAGAPKTVIDLRKDLIRAAGDRVHFNFDSAALDKEAQENLQNVAAFIKENAHRIQNVTVEGHCDERGTREYNLALGERRAVSAKRYLVGLGIDADMINTISYGKERPVDPRHIDRAWQRNRRAVVVLE